MKYIQGGTFYQSLHVWPFSQAHEGSIILKVRTLERLVSMLFHE